MEGGTYTDDSLGAWIDALTGDRKQRRAARLALEPLFAKDDEVPDDPEPVEIPASVPGGTEPITKGDDPPREHR